MDDLTKEFLQESSENLDRLDQDFVKWEKEPSNLELVKSIFRAIHTIKGTCGFLGFTKLEALAHAGESSIALVPIDAYLKLVGLRGTTRAERKRCVLGSSTASGESWKAVEWPQNRGEKLKSKKLTETPYFRSIKQLRWTALTFLGQHGFNVASHCCPVVAFSCRRNCW